MIPYLRNRRQSIGNACRPWAILVLLGLALSSRVISSGEPDMDFGGVSSPMREIVVEYLPGELDLYEAILDGHIDVYTPKYKTEYMLSHFNILAIEMHHFHIGRGAYLPAVLYNDDKVAQHSWRWLLFKVRNLGPDFRCAWNEGRNWDIAARTPLDRGALSKGRPPNETALVAVTAADFVFDDDKRTRFSDIKAAGSNPILVAHVEKTGIPAAMPKDFTFEEFWSRYETKNISECNDEGFLALFHDLKVRLVVYGLEKPELRKLFTVSGK